MKRLYASAKQEYPEPVPGNITGDVPDWLNGSLYRNGPGLFEVGQSTYNHWFDGMAVIQRFKVTPQEVTYQRRFLQSETYKTNMAAKRIAVTEFATSAYPDPCKGVFARALSFVTDRPDPTDNTNVNIVVVGEELYTSSEGNYLHRIDSETLATVERLVLSDSIPINPTVAHTHTGSDGNVHAFGYQFGTSVKYSFVEIPPRNSDGGGGYSQGKLVASVTAESVTHPSFSHSFGMTDNYYVFAEQPMMFNVLKIMKAALMKNNMLDCIQWDPEYCKNLTRLHVVDRKSGKDVNIKYPYVAEAFLVLHHINTYEEKVTSSVPPHKVSGNGGKIERFLRGSTVGHLVVDVCGYHEGSVMSRFNLKDLTSDKCEDVMHSMPRPIVRRYVLPLDINETTPSDVDLVNLPGYKSTAILRNKHVVCNYEKLCQESFESPQINYPMSNGKKYNYIYGIGFQEAPRYEPSLFKTDITEGASLIWHEEGCFPSEAIFVGRPGATEEDDGVVVSVVSTYGDDQDDFLLLLDARTMTETARVTYPGIRFPKDHHGVFVQK